MGKIRVAILGSGNIGTDLMYKVLRSPVLELAMMVGIDPASDGLARARALGIETSHEGISFIVNHANPPALVFDATSARAHVRHNKALQEAGIPVIDLTPAALGPYVIPAVNLGEHLDAPNINLITCGGQATIPIIHAIHRICPVEYGEIVATVASKSAGPGTRQNIDEFTLTTALGIEVIGGARKGKAIIILNPADPPIIMRDTVYARVTDPQPAAIIASIQEMVAAVQQYVPGYRLRGEPLVEGNLVTTFLEVEGAGDYLPTYSGNLDIMTAAAVRVGEAVARHRAGAGAATP